MPTDYEDAARRIAQYEDFSPFAAWDVNAFRLGYGSDTEGPEQSPVKPYSWTTKEAALANLAIRIKEFEKTIVAQVGQDAWDRLTTPQRTSLLSFGYNYGSLTRGVAAAVRRGDPAAIEAAVSARAVDGPFDSNRNPVNAGRRADEAKAFATQPSAAGHLRQASAHQAILSALALGPGTYSRAHRHRRST